MDIFHQIQKVADSGIKITIKGVTSCFIWVDIIICIYNNGPVLPSTAKKKIIMPHTKSKIGKYSNKMKDFQ